MARSLIDRDVHLRAMSCVRLPELSHVRFARYLIFPCFFYLPSFFFCFFFHDHENVILLIHRSTNYINTDYLCPSVMLNFGVSLFVEHPSFVLWRLYWTLWRKRVFFFEGSISMISKMKSSKFQSISPCIVPREICSLLVGFCLVA